MEIKEIQRREPKKVPISIRTTVELSEFMKKKNISPNAVFDKAVRELMKEK